MLTTLKRNLQFGFSVSWILDQTATLAVAFYTWRNSQQGNQYCGLMMFTLVYAIFHVEYEIFGMMALARLHVRTLLTYAIMLLVHSVAFLVGCVMLVSNGHSYLVFIKSGLLFVQLWLVWHNLIHIAEFKHRAFLNSVPLFRFRAGHPNDLQVIPQYSVNSEMLMVTLRPLSPVNPVSNNSNNNTTPAITTQNCS